MRLSHSSNVSYSSHPTMIFYPLGGSLSRSLMNMGPEIRSFHHILFVTLTLLIQKAEILEKCNNI